MNECHSWRINQTAYVQMHRRFECVVNIDFALRSINMQKMGHYSDIYVSLSSNENRRM